MLDNLAQESESLPAGAGMKELRRSSLYERCAARTDRLTICAVLEVLSV